MVKFYCDAMMGHMARWLRLMGFDAEYADHRTPDTAVLEAAAAGSRILVTRDVQLVERARRRGVPAVEAPPGSLEEEIINVLKGAQIGLEAAAWFTRCTRCNGVLVPARLSEVRDRVPPHVQARTDDYRRCPACSHVYWEGTHVDEIKTKLAAVAARL